MKNNTKKVLSVGVAGAILLSTLTGCDYNNTTYDSIYSALDSIECEELTEVDDIFDEETLEELYKTQAYLVYSDLIVDYVSEFYAPMCCNNGNDVIVLFHSFENENLNKIKAYTREEVEECLDEVFIKYDDYANGIITGDQYVNFLEDIHFFDYVASINYYLSTKAPELLTRISNEYLKVYENEGNNRDSYTSQLEDNLYFLDTIYDVDEGYNPDDIYVGYNSNRNLKLENNIDILTRNIGEYSEKLNKKHPAISL